jgi:hypothetical protein
VIHEWVVDLVDVDAAVLQGVRGRERVPVAGERRISCALLSGEELVSNVAGGGRQPNAPGLAPDGAVDFILVSDDQGPFAFSAMKMASLILRPERLFFALTSFQSRTLPNLSRGSSSLISRRRHSVSVSRGRLRPPGNIHKPSRRRRTKSTLPRLAATSLADFDK